MAPIENQVEAINVAYPETGELHLRLGVGACQLRIVPGEGEAWVAGKYRHPVDTLPLRIEQNGGNVRISQETSRWGGLWGVMDRDSVPRFELTLGKNRPYSLTLELGASENEIELGGLPLTGLIIRQGAGKVTLGFSAPNPQAMKVIELASGASSVEMRGLGNANCGEMRCEGGAAGYQFDFGGQLRRDMSMSINTGMAGVDLNIPAAAAARIAVEAVMGGVDVGDGFLKREGAYYNEAAVAGKVPMLTVRAKIAMGGIKLRSLH